LDLTQVNDNLIQYDARGRSSTDQFAQGQLPNADATTLFQLPFSTAQQTRAILTAEVLNSGGGLFPITSVVVTSEPPGLTLGIDQDTGGQPQSDSRILSPGDYQIALSIFTPASIPGAQI
jgi:hypothetical protein